MKTHSRNVLLLLLFIGAIVAVRMSGAGNVLTFENLQKNKDVLLTYVRDHSALSVIIYLAVYVATVALNLPGGAVLSVAGGFLFGTAPAIVYVNIGATSGAVLAFLSARYLLGSRLQERYQDRLAKFDEEMAKNGIRYLITLRLIPFFPFFVVNFLAGLTRVPLGMFVWTTSIGIIPASAVFAFAGHQLEHVHAVSDILSAKVLSAFLLLAVFVLAPAIIGRFRKSDPSPPSS